MHFGTCERPRTIHGVPNRDDRRAQDHPGRHAWTAGDRRADHEWKDDVFDWMRGNAKNLSEYHLRGEQRRRDPCRRSNQLGLRPGAIQDGKNGGSEDDGTQGVTQPPIEPEHWESAPGLNASKCQSGDTKRGADGRASDCRDEHKGEDVTDSVKCGFEPTRSAQPPHGRDGFQRVSRGDDECGPGRCLGSEIGDQRSDPNTPVQGEAHPRRARRGRCRSAPKPS